MKHRALKISAYFLVVLAGLTALAGIVVTIIVGIGMTAVTARLAVILAGFILTAISAIILLAVSQLLLLFVRIEEDLTGLAAALKSKMGD